jgi:hypothetical protein
MSCLGVDGCQDFEFPVLLVLLYVRVAGLFHVELDPTNSHSPPAMLWPATAYVVPVWNAVFQQWPLLRGQDESGGNQKLGSSR